MTVLRLALLADGAGDRALLPILSWALKSAAPDVRFFEPEFEVRHGHLVSEIERISSTLRPDILFVHRDAEREPLDVRRGEIPMANGRVRVVPVRMTEAWLLIDGTAIRRAASNPNGRVSVDLPGVSRLEGLPDPKETLWKLLVEATEYPSGRRKQRFLRDIGRRVHLVAEYTDDFSLLRELAAFQAFEEDLRHAIHR